MRNYEWWLGRKHRVRKKYTLMLGSYLSPKELRDWYKDFKKAQRNARKKRKKNLLQNEGKRNRR